MRQRLGLADVLIKNPDIIILDEPTLGIDPKGVREFLELIVELSKEKGLTVLFSSHHLHQVQQVCDRVGLFINGKLIAEGNIQALSGKLFGSSPFVIELAVGGEKQSSSWLHNILKDINGLVSVNSSNGLFEVQCTRDISAEIARAVVLAGIDLKHLNKKEYGLDEIYYRFFEGGLKNE